MKENDADYVVLVIKKPSCCWECRFEHFGLCMASQERYSIKYLNAIPALCPLKPIPQKKADENGNISEQKEWIENEWDFISGWNACLEEINATEKVINAKNVALKG